MDLEARLKEVGQRPVLTPKVVQQITLSAPETVIISGKGSDDKGEGDDKVAPPDKLNGIDRRP